MIFIAGGNAYKLVHNHKNGWNLEAFRDRYSEVLNRYDFIVGDWGYNQLRLKGFYRDDHPKAAKDTAISGLVDYLNEYCNFGCAYFVLAKTDRKQLPPDEPVVTIELPTISDGSAGEDGGSGLLMRWPPKERANAPVRPHVSAYDLARASAEMEKRREAAEAASSGQRHASGRGQGVNGAKRAGERRPAEAGEKTVAASGAGAGGTLPGGNARNAAAGGVKQSGAPPATGMAHGTSQGSGAPQASGAASGSFKPGRTRGRSKSKAKRTPHAQLPDRSREAPRDAGSTGSAGTGWTPRDEPDRAAGAEPHDQIRVSGIQAVRQQEASPSAKVRPAAQRGGHWGPNRRRGRFHGKPDRQSSGQPPRSEG